MNSMQFIHLFKMIVCGCLIAVLLLSTPGCKKMGEPVNEETLSHSNGGRNMQDVDIRLIADNMISPIGVVALPGNGQRGKGDHSDNDKRKQGDDRRLFVIDQAGKIWIIDKHGKKLTTPFLDITAKMVPLSPFYDERGLLGFAFHPDYKKNGRFFVYYTAPPRAGGPAPGILWNNLSKIVEFKVSAWNPNIADAGSEKVIMEIDDPQSNHNGGTIAFGPDRYLYIAIGDGGGANDVGPGHVEDWYTVNQGGNGQDVVANLFGNILRIDVNKGTPYRIPHDNPFVGKTGRDEIYAYGFRNPFRFSFDMEGSHQLFAGDAGQLLYEEVSIVKKGGNYGWNVKEGTHCFSTANPLVELASCPMTDPFGNRLIDPVIELNNSQNPKGGKATTIIGGNVYRGNKIRQFEGKYIFGTFSQSFAPNGELFIAHPRSSGLWSFQEIALKSSPNDLGYFLKGFGQDQEGEIYLTVSSNLGPSGIAGKVFKLVPVKQNKHYEDDEEDED